MILGLGKNTGALVTAVLTLAVGIGFSTATFSVTNAVLLWPLPYDEPSRTGSADPRRGGGRHDVNLPPGVYASKRC